MIHSTVGCKFRIRRQRGSRREGVLQLTREIQIGERTVRRTKNLVTPATFGVYSVWGNQWLKLLAVYDLWARKIDILLNAYDILRASTPRRDLLRNQTISLALPWSLRNDEQIIRQRKAIEAAFSVCLSQQRLPEVHPRFTILDSGGFNFWRTTDDGSPAFASIDDDRLQAAFGQSPEAAQEYIFRLQQEMQPDIAITLDKVIPHDLTEEKKAERWEYSLRCAKKALWLKKKYSPLPFLLFPVIHAYGPASAGLSRNHHKLVAYRESAARYVEQLMKHEDQLGTEFDGFAVGSLIPLGSRYDVIGQIVAGIKEYLNEDRLRPLHAMGATGDKSLALGEMGFDIFDTNYHRMLGTHRRYMEPSSGKVLNLQDSGDCLKAVQAQCSCPVCARFPPQTLTRLEKGLKEVPTVLLSIHSLVTWHQVSKKRSLLAEPQKTLL